jgi:hypothetical protein
LASPPRGALAFGIEGEGLPSGPRHIGTCDGDPDVARFTIAHLNDMQARYGELLAGRSRYAYVAGTCAASRRRT